MTSAYYNEYDAFAADWLEALIEDGLIAPGVVDRRSIEDVEPGDLDGFVQCHFFAGIGGWSYALRLAGWPDDRPVWTGSCPCQPFSVAGKRVRFDDDRHLWPIWRGLMLCANPDVVLGEQVADKAWRKQVTSDFESMEYHVDGRVCRASGVGAPHRRSRFYFAANALGARMEGLVTGGSAGEAGPWGWCGEADLQALGNAPFEPGDRWPQPMLRGVDDGLPTGMAAMRRQTIHGFGNAIVPQVAAKFVKAFMESTSDE